MSIEVIDVSVGHGAHTVLSEIDFTCNPGTISALIGPNGSGKSTLLRGIAGVSDFRGVIQIGGAPLATFSRKERVRKLAFVAQYTETNTDLTVHQIVSLGRIAGRGPWATANEEDQQLVEQALSDADIAHLADRPWSRLSGGEKQRTHVARALAQGAQCLVLDEPTNHLDIRHQYALLDLLTRLAHERRVCVLAAIHDLGLASRFCDQVIALHDGGVIARGVPKEVLTPEIFDSVFGIKAQLVASNEGTISLECAGTVETK